MFSTSTWEVDMFELGMEFGERSNATFEDFWTWRIYIYSWQNLKIMITDLRIHGKTTNTNYLYSELQMIYSILYRPLKEN